MRRKKTRVLASWRKARVQNNSRSIRIPEEPSEIRRALIAYAPQIARVLASWRKARIQSRESKSVGIRR
jgi:hypothetical protein